MPEPNFIAIKIPLNGMQRRQNLLRASKPSEAPVSAQ